tara:strand:+ start:233 stop:649 length:417 start_codon:yes stop_codon:yes gene_type:complete
MGYKHSPSNAKMSAFMNKMNNTEKSPARQNDKGGMKTIDYGNDFSISVEKDDPRSDKRVLAQTHDAAQEKYLQAKESGDEAMMNEASNTMRNTGQTLHRMGLSTDMGVANKQLNTGKYKAASNIPDAKRDNTRAEIGG